jgi:hypothetical protein
MCLLESAQLLRQLLLYLLFRLRYSEISITSLSLQGTIWLALHIFELLV